MKGLCMLAHCHSYATRCAIRQYATRPHWRRRVGPPKDTLVEDKLQQKSAPDFAKTPQLVEKFHQDYMRQPRSMMRLPVESLIKDRRVATQATIPCNTQASITPVSHAEQLLATMRNRDTEVIPRLESFVGILKSFALEGAHERAEAVVLDMKRDFGVRPDETCMSLLALAYFNGGRRDTAMALLEKTPHWDTVAQTMHKLLISDALKSNDSSRSWQLFAAVRQHALPSPELVGMMLMHCGKTGYVERGLKLYGEIVAEGMEPNPVTHAAMVYLCTRRKDTFDRAVEFYEQMQLLDFSMHLRVHNYMLQGCGKVADLQRAVSIWNHLVETATPNEVTVASVLWALASIETPEHKLSLRTFHYDMTPEKLVETATEIYRQGSRLVPANSHTANAYLAVLTNNLRREQAEAFFHQEMKGAQGHTEHSYELMFKMYDTLRDLKQTVALKEIMEQERLVVPFEGWRAMIRTAALGNDVDLALQYLKEMTSHGYRPSLEDLKVVNLRICELRKFALKPQLEEMCMQPSPVPDNSYIAWRQRSLALHNLFQSLYGRTGPKLATTNELLNKSSLPTHQTLVNNTE